MSENTTTLLLCRETTADLFGSQAFPDESPSENRRSDQGSEPFPDPLTRPSGRGTIEAGLRSPRLLATSRVPAMAVAGTLSVLGTERGARAVRLGMPYSLPPADSSDGARTPPEASPCTVAGTIKKPREIVVKAGRAARRADLIRLLSPCRGRTVRRARRIAEHRAAVSRPGSPGGDARESTPTARARGRRAAPAPPAPTRRCARAPSCRPDRPASPDPTRYL